jgi:alpha,alpha-trehalose phosphorylase
MTLAGKSPLTVEPWRLRELFLDQGLLARTESLFALSNGHVGVRGNLDEGEPHVLPGTYLNSVHELRPLPHAEAGYGYPESGQSVINVTNGKTLRLLVDDEPFDVRYGTVHRHERALDFRTGLLSRDCEWESPAGRTVRVRSQRLVSMTHRAVLAVCYEVEAVEARTRVVVQSELVADEELPDLGGDDPRVAAALGHPLEARDGAGRGHGGYLVHRTRRSGIHVATAMENIAEAPREVRVRTESAPDWVRVGMTTTLEPGEVLRIVKLVAYGWSAHRSCRPCATRSRRRSPRPAPAAGSSWSTSSAPSSTSSGRAPTSRSTATRSCSRPSGWRCSTSCSPPSAPSAGRSRPRG